MTGYQTFAGCVALSVVAAGVGAIAVSSDRLTKLPRRSFDRGVIAAFVLSRLALYFLLFFILRVRVRGDVPVYYFRQAVMVLHHLVPYRDFQLSYAPLHPYLDALILRAWHSPLSLMLFPTLVEMLVLPLWLRIGRRFLAENEVRLASLLYLTSPLSLHFVTVDGKDNVVIAVLIALAFLLVLRRREILSGVCVGFSVAAIKFLPLIYMPAFFVALPRRWRWAAGAVLVMAAVYGGFLLLHAPVLQPISVEGNLQTAGDLPYLFDAVIGVAIPPGVADGVVLIALAGIVVLVGNACRGLAMEPRLRVLCFGLSALTLAVILLAKKSWPAYLMMSFFTICMLPVAVPAHRRLRIWAFLLFSIVANVEHSFLTSVIGLYSSHRRQEYTAVFLRQDLLMHNRDALIFLVLEVLLMAGYVWLLVEAVRQVVAARRLAEVPLAAV